MNPTADAYARIKALLIDDASIKALLPGNLVFFDDATAGHREASRVLPNDKTTLSLEYGDETDGLDVAATFRTRSAAGVLVDYGVPVSPTFTLTVRSESPTAAKQQAIVNGVRRALLGQGRTMGLSWVGEASLRWMHGRDIQSNISQWTSVATVTVKGQVMLSQLLEA